MSKQVFESWVDEYANDVYRYFHRGKGLDANTADELTQRTFVAVWESMDQYARQSAPKAWILGVARNVGKMAFRERKRNMNPPPQDARPLTPSQFENSPEDLLEAKRNYEVLTDILATLDEKKREVFHLRYIQQLSVDEIVAALQLPKETVRSRLRLAREAIKIEWKQRTRKEPV